MFAQSLRRFLVVVSLGLMLCAAVPSFSQTQVLGRISGTITDNSGAVVPGGKVTAGSSSQICDGAAAVLVASERAVEQLGLEPRARFVAFGLAGVDPRLMLHGNPQASERALAKAGLGWDDIAVIEVNEAFASVALQFMRDSRLEDRADDVNPNGGGISLGHPLGATGARITATLLNELERRDARYAVATMCIGFGQAIAAVVETL